MHRLHAFRDGLPNFETIIIVRADIILLPLSGKSAGITLQRALKYNAKENEMTGITTGILDWVKFDQSSIVIDFYDDVISFTIVLIKTIQYLIGRILLSRQSISEQTDCVSGDCIYELEIIPNQYQRIFRMLT